MSREVKIAMPSGGPLPTIPQGHLRKCEDCMYSNRDCTFCSELGKHIFPYQYACTRFRSDEEEKARRKAEKLAKAERMERKLNFLLTALFNCSSATQMMLEDFDSRFEDQNVEREWRHNTKYAYSKIREHLNECRKLYNRYIQPDFDRLFTENGTQPYDVEKYDHHSQDAMELCRLYLLYIDRCWDDEDAANKVVGFIADMPSGDLFDEKDIEHYRMKR